MQEPHFWNFALIQQYEVIKLGLFPLLSATNLYE